MLNKTLFTAQQVRDNEALAASSIGNFKLRFYLKSNTPTSI